MSIGSTRVQQAAVASETGRAFSVVGVRRADGLSYLDEPLTHIFALNPNIDRDLGYRSCDNALSFRRTGPSVVSLTWRDGRWTTADGNDDYEHALRTICTSTCQTHFLRTWFDEAQTGQGRTWQCPNYRGVPRNSLCRHFLILVWRGKFSFKLLFKEMFKTRKASH